MKFWKIIGLLLILVVLTGCNKKTYVVQFFVDEVLIKEEQVEEGKKSTPPLNPIKEGYTFIKWDQDYNVINSNLQINAIFEKNSYTVRFLVDNQIYDIKNVLYQESVILPVDPVKEGYVFKNWNQDISCVTSDIDVIAIFEINEVYVEDVIEDKLLEIDESMKKYPNIIEDDIVLVSSDEKVNVKWESSNSDVISEEGVLIRPFSEEKYITVTLIVSVEYQNITRSQIYSFNVERKYKDLSNGINAVYNSYSTISENSLYIYDIIYPSFLYISGDVTGNLKNEAEVIKKTDSYIKGLHKNGGRILPSLAVQSSSDIENLKTIIEDNQALDNLVNNLLNFCIENDYDGIDMDWETPGSSGGELYTKLMKKLYQIFKNYDKDLLVTSAIGAGPWQYKKYDLINSNMYHDYINMMSYSMENGSVSTFQNALFYKKGACLTQCSVDTGIDIYQSVGIKLEQIIVGIPFYGRIFSDTLGLNTDGTKGNAPNQETIKSNILNKTYQYFFDEDCKVPYLYNEVEKKFITYESPKSILIKWDYIKENKLAGMMAWNYRQDYNDLLTNAMHFGKTSGDSVEEELNSLSNGEINYIKSLYNYKVLSGAFNIEELRIQHFLGEYSEIYVFMMENDDNKDINDIYIGEYLFKKHSLVTRVLYMGEVYRLDQLESLNIMSDDELNAFYQEYNKLF